MFNRKLEVKVVKNNKKETALVAQEDLFEKKVAVISNFLTKMFHKAAVAALAYVVLDTAREVILNKTTEK